MYWLKKQTLIPLVLMTASLCAVSVPSGPCYAATATGNITLNADAIGQGDPPQATPADADEDDSAGARPRIHIAEPIFDFGVIRQGETIEHTFEVQNTGDEPLILYRAKSS